MHSLESNNLVSLLRTLSAVELKKFEKFLNSPYHNSIANVRKLFRVIRNFAPGFSGTDFTREYVWKSAFPEKEFSYGILKNLLHELTVLCQKFLVAEAIDNNAELRERILIEQLLGRNAGKISGKRLSEFWKKFNAESTPDSRNSIQESYHYASDIFWIKTARDKTTSLKIPGDSEYFLGSAYSTITYFAGICKEFNNAIADSSASSIIFEKQIPVMIAKALNSGLMDEILAELKKHSLKDYRVLDTYVAINKAQIHEGNFSLFKESRSKLIDNAELFSKMDLKDLYNNLLSALTLLDGFEVNKSEEMLINFDLMSESGILTDDKGNLGAMYFYYYLVCAFRSLRFNKISPFSDKYFSKTTGDDPENLRNFDSALSAFGEREYDRALKMISHMKHVSRYIDFFIREFKACCFYELGEEKFFEREYKALPYILKTHKIHVPKISVDLKFHFDIVRYLFALRKEFDMKLYKNVSEKLGKSRVWLLKNLDEIYERRQ